MESERAGSTRPDDHSTSSAKPDADVPAGAPPTHRCPNCRYLLPLVLDEIIRCPECGTRCRLRRRRSTSSLFLNVLGRATFGAMANGFIVLVSVAFFLTGTTAAVSAAGIIIAISGMTIAALIRCVAPYRRERARLVWSAFVVAHWFVAVVPIGAAIIVISTAAAPIAGMFAIVGVPVGAIVLCRRAHRELQRVAMRVEASRPLPPSSTTASPAAPSVPPTSPDVSAELP